MNIQLKDQLLYIIANEELGYEEYNLPSSCFYSSHLETYSEFLLENPELNLGFTLDRGLPEQLNRAGMVVYQGFGNVSSNNKEYFNGFEYSGGLLLPKEFKEIQRKKLIARLDELKEIFIEFCYYKNNETICVCDEKTEEYSAYQKLKKILYNEK